MANITYRGPGAWGNGSPSALTILQVDTNFYNLDQNKLEKGDNLAGLTDQAAARTSLGLAGLPAIPQAALSPQSSYYLRGDGTWSNALSSAPATVNATTGLTNIDFTASSKFIVNMYASTTFAFLNASDGQDGVLFIKQDATGGRTFSLPSSAKTPKGGAAIVQSTAANSISILSYVVLNSSTILVNYIGDFR